MPYRLDVNSDHRTIMSLMAKESKTGSLHHVQVSLIFFLIILVADSKSLAMECKDGSSHLLPIVADDDDRNGLIGDDANTTMTRIYIVHVLPPPPLPTAAAAAAAADHQDPLDDQQHLKAWYSSFLPNATLDSGLPRMVYTYRHAIIGFAARLTQEEVDEMERTKDGFVSAQPELMLPLGTTYTPNFLDLNQYSNSLWHSSNQGKGIVIGVLDTGIDPEHPSFSDNGMLPPPATWRGCCEFKDPKCSNWKPVPCNNKLIAARAFGYRSALDDYDGHGLHTAGIAAGNFVQDADVLGQAKGTASGMAPRAHVASYRVCDDKSCQESSILYGIEQAIFDGVDVLSLSIINRSFSRFQDSNINKGTFAAMERGIFSSLCAGNEGPDKSSVNSDMPWVLTVGASSIDRIAKATVKLGNGMEFDGASAYQPGSAEGYTPVMMPIAYPGNLSTGKASIEERKICQTLDALRDTDVKGHIVLCGIGITYPVDKGKLVKMAGGAAIIIMNQASQGFTILSDPHAIPAAHVSHVDALKIINYFQTATNPTATIIFKGTQFGPGARRAPAVAYFSSRGPSLKNGGILKPDIIGPGIDILSAWAKEVGPNPSGSTTSHKIFNFDHGCSMATPHLAGVAALLKSAHPDWSPAAVKSAIMTTAHTVDREGKPIYDESSNTREPATYFQMGAGHVDPARANDPGLVYDVGPDDYIAYLCGSGYSTIEIYLITKRAMVDCNAITKISAAELNLPSIMISNLKASATVHRTVTNVGDAGESYTAQVDAPEGVGVTVSPDQINFSRKGEAAQFAVFFDWSGTGNQKPKNDNYAYGKLTWASSNHTVTSPLIVGF